MERINLTEILGPRDPKVAAEIRQQLDIAQRLYDLRSDRGLSQAEAARMARTTAAVINRMEESDYDLHRSLQILDRLVKALGTDSPLTYAAGTAAGTL